MSTQLDENILEGSYGYGIGAVTFALLGVGLGSQSPALVLCAAVGLVFSAFRTLDRQPLLDDTVQIQRELTDTDTHMDTDVSVRVTVQNTSETFLPDLRIVDGIPNALEVVDGSPRAGIALRAGESVNFEYTVVAERGDHTWEPATVIVSNASGSIEHETRVEATTETRLRCAPLPVSTGRLPVRGLTSQFDGRVSTDTGGSGIEFFGTRDYQDGDPFRRIDWHRLARDGELGTIDFREEHGVNVVFLIDARRAAYLAPAVDATSAVDRSVTAVAKMLDALLQTGDRFGLAVFGREEAWLPPGAGTGHRARATTLLAEHQALSVAPPERSVFGGLPDDRREELLWERVDRLHRRLPADAQVFCLSPCCDEFMPTVVRRLDGHGHPVTVISPDPTTDDTTGRVLAQLAREYRLRRLVQAGLRVIDWDHTTEFESAMAQANSRWSP